LGLQPAFKGAHYRKESNLHQNSFWPPRTQTVPGPGKFPALPQLAGAAAVQGRRQA